ncbi:MAG: hypothetical protein IJE11_02585 [Bacteroidales bacterium]|nr:hypothetical protein [Bacteroidales bacterium]
MKRLLIILTAGLTALLSFNSCEISRNEFDASSIDAYLTVYYAGGISPVTVQGRYDLDYPRLSDREVESIFYDLSGLVQPGFLEATLEVEYFDWMDNYIGIDVFEFWWETYDMYTGDGAYLWEEVEP